MYLFLHGCGWMIYLWRFDTEICGLHLPSIYNSFLPPWFFNGQLAALPYSTDLISTFLMVVTIRHRLIELPTPSSERPQSWHGLAIGWFWLGREWIFCMCWLRKPPRHRLISTSPSPPHPTPPPTSLGLSTTLVFIPLFLFQITAIYIKEKGRLHVITLSTVFSNSKKSWRTFFNQLVPVVLPMKSFLELKSMISKCSMNFLSFYCL